MNHHQMESFLSRWAVPLMQVAVEWEETLNSYSKILKYCNKTARVNERFNAREKEREQYKRAAILNNSFSLLLSCWAAQRILLYLNCSHLDALVNELMLKKDWIIFKAASVWKSSPQHHVHCKSNRGTRNLWRCCAALSSSWWVAQSQLQPFWMAGGTNSPPCLCYTNEVMSSLSAFWNSKNDFYIFIPLFKPRQLSFSF